MVCFRCGSGDLVTRTLCIKHSRFKNKECRERYKKRFEDGRCLYCGGDNDTQSMTCSMCFFKKISIRYLGNTQHWDEFKIKLEEQNYTCSLSGEKLIIGKNIAVDHIVPLCKGGENELDNLQFTTKRANFMKYDMSIVQLKKMCKKILNHLNKKELFTCK